jgi:hypothetical protein
MPQLVMTPMTVQPTADMLTAQRQQEIASLLMQQALKQPSVPQGGMYTPKMGAIQALAPMVSALLASRQQDKADATTRSALAAQKAELDSYPQKFADFDRGDGSADAAGGANPPATPSINAQPDPQNQALAAILSQGRAANTGGPMPPSADSQTSAPDSQALANALSQFPSAPKSEAVSLPLDLANDTKVTASDRFADQGIGPRYARTTPAPANVTVGTGPPKSALDGLPKSPIPSSSGAQLVPAQTRYAQALALAMRAQQAGMPESLAKSWAEAHAPTEQMKNYQGLGFTSKEAHDYYAAAQRKDGYIAPVVINGVAFDPQTGRPVMSAPDQTTGIQQIPNGDGTFRSVPSSHFNTARAATEGATTYAHEAATLDPRLVQARVGQAGATRGAEQANTVFPNQTLTMPDGSVRDGVPVTGAQIFGSSGAQDFFAPQPGSGPMQREAPAQGQPQAPFGQPSFGSDPKRREVEAAVSQKDLEALMDKGRAAQSGIDSLNRIEAYVKSGSLGGGPIDRLQNYVNDKGFPTKAAINTQLIGQEGDNLKLAFGSLGASVSNADAQTYARAQGDFAAAQSNEQRLAAISRMRDVYQRAMARANQGFTTYRNQGRTPAYQGAQPAPQMQPHPIIDPQAIQAEMRRRRLIP